jgi:hypothetical protein
MNFFKLIGLIATFNDVASSVKDTYPDGAPFYYHQRFWGALVSLASGILAYVGISYAINNEAASSQLTTAAIAVGPIITGIYGLALHIKGWVDAKNRKAIAITK